MSEPIREFVHRVYTTYDVPCGEIGLEDDGDVSIDWYLNSWRMLSISVSPEGRLAWAGLFDERSEHGNGWDNGKLDEMFKLIEKNS